MARISVLRRIEEKEKEEGKTREKWLLASWFSLDGDVDRPVILREINSYWLHTGIVKTLASRSPPSVLSLNYRQFVVHRLILFNRRPIFPRTLSNFIDTNDFNNFLVIFRTVFFRVLLSLKSWAKNKADHSFVMIFYIYKLKIKECSFLLYSANFNLKC